MTMNKYNIIMDCDGILTSTNLSYDIHGKTHKHFSVNDSLMVKFVQDHYSDKINMQVLTGDISPGLDITSTRLKQLNLEYVHCQNADKYSYIMDNFDPAKVIYVGDDIFDFVIFKNVHYSCTVNNAPAIIKSHASYVSPYIGGANAVTDILYHVLTGVLAIDPLKDMEKYVLDRHEAGALKNDKDEVQV